MRDTDIWQRIAERKQLDDDLRGEIESAFGLRGKKALAAIDDKKILKYRDFFVVEGKTSQYIVDDDFCTCSDFLYRGRTCWHLLAVRIAEASGMYRPVNSWFQDQLKNNSKQNLD